MRVGFFIFFLLVLFGDFIANEKPLYCKIDGKVQYPAFRQKGIDWNLAQADANFFSRNWLTFNAYESVIKAPVPFSATTLDVQNGNFKAPFQTVHLLGTDNLGRDVLAGIIHGCSIAFWIGLGATFLAVLLGVLLGAIAGYFADYWDILIMKIIEVKRTIPSLLWIFAIAAVIDKCTIWHIILIIGGLGWTGIAQLMRAEVLKTKNEDYALAAKTLGLSTWQTLFKHILPNSLSPIYVAGAFMVSQAILAEASLSFLGIGLPTETVTWGSMLQQATRNISAWWMAIFPGACLFLVIVLFNKLAENRRKKA